MASTFLETFAAMSAASQSIVIAYLKGLEDAAQVAAKQAPPVFQEKEQK